MATAPATKNHEQRPVVTQIAKVYYVVDGVIVCKFQAVPVRDSMEIKAPKMACKHGLHHFSSASAQLVKISPVYDLNEVPVI